MTEQAKAAMERIERELLEASDPFLTAPFSKADVTAVLARVRELEAMTQWIKVSERLPEPMTKVLVAFEMDRPGDWRISCASYEPLCHEFSIVNQGGWRIFGGGWKPTRWMPLPATPALATIESK